MILGGYTLEGEALALEGHSDADVLLHALADALLGALGLGDIGAYFPDTDESFKNMDSSIIMLRALDEMKIRNYTLSNVDITLVGERPRILPHRPEIKKSLVEILGIEDKQIAVKATTTEKMGALGRKEGLACLATVTIQKKKRIFLRLTAITLIFLPLLPLWWQGFVKILMYLAGS